MFAICLLPFVGAFVLIGTIRFICNCYKIINRKLKNKA